MIISLFYFTKYCINWWILLIFYNYRWCRDLDKKEAKDASSSLNLLFGVVTSKLNSARPGSSEVDANIQPLNFESRDSDVLSDS